MACKKGQFDDVEMILNNHFNAFSINFNAQFDADLALSGKLVKNDVRLLDTLE